VRAREPTRCGWMRELLYAAPESFGVHPPSRRLGTISAGPLGALDALL
jgi:hypothetical protein